MMPILTDRVTEPLELKTGWVVPAARLQRMAMVLARHGFSELAQRVLAGRPTGGPGATLLGSTSRIGERIARVLGDLGPTYSKLGQLLATREDLFPPDVTRALARLHASVPPMKARLTLRAIRNALGVEAQVAFAWFDPEPLAAASIGQVHRARLASGEQVVVKVQRPGVRATIAADLQLLRWMASLLSRAMPEVAAIDPLSLIDAFERSILGELDFRREAENAVRLGRLLAGAREVRVPRIYHEWTRPTLLVLEHIRGRRLEALDVASQKEARANLLRAFSRQILDHGVFHADPHPGNVLVEDDGRVVLLDLGAVDAVDEPLRAGLGRLVRAIALGQKRALCEAVLALSPDGATVAIDRAKLEADLEKLVADAAGQGTGAQVLGQMVAVGRNHKLRMQPSLVALVRAMALLDGVLRGLDPARDLVADLRREMLHSFLRRIGRFFGRLTAPLERVRHFWTRLRWRARRALPPHR